jgi:hypothetical protein
MFYYAVSHVEPEPVPVSPAAEEEASGVSLFEAGASAHIVNDGY